MANLDNAFEIPLLEQPEKVIHDQSLKFTWDEMIRCIAKQNNLNPNPNLYTDLHNGPVNGHIYVWYSGSQTPSEIYSHPVNRNVHRCQ